MDIPLCELDHTPQIFLDDPDDLPLYRQVPERFAGAIAPDSAACAEWARSLDPLPVGLVLECPPVPDEDECERPVTMDYIRRCKRAFRPLLLAWVVVLAAAFLAFAWRAVREKEV